MNSLVERCIRKVWNKDLGRFVFILPQNEGINSDLPKQSREVYE